MLSDGPDAAQHNVELAKLKPTLIRGALLLLETAVIPTLLLYACTITVGQLWGLGAVLGWCALCVGARMTRRQRIPSMLLFAVGGLAGRTTLALLFSNVYIYLFQPIIGSLFMALVFLGSAAIGRPITVPLAKDFVALPSQLFGDRRVRRIFINVSLIWGVSRLIDVGMSVGFLQFSLDAGLLSRGLLSTLLTVGTIALCAVWGWRQIRRVPGVTFTFA
ncbi:MAG TPA: VC0807 family protein [Mycobacterium sp.]|nr:VC0807 family protein [Mycobacterium sp.]